MSLRADHYDSVPAFETSRQRVHVLPVRYVNPPAADAVAIARPTFNLPEDDAHSLMRQALIEQKRMVIELADGQSSVSFSGSGSNLLVEQNSSGHRGLYPLCTAGWIIWEIYRGCPTRVLSDLLAFIPVESATA